MRFIKSAWLIFIIIFAITGTTIIYQSTEEAKAIKSTVVMSSTSTIIDHKYENDFPGLHLRTETANTGKYTMSITIPTADHDDINDPISDWIGQQKDKFLSEVLELNNSLIAHLNIQLETKKVNKDLYSLVFTSSKLVDGSDEQTNIQPFMLNIEENKIIHLQDLFDLNEKLSDELYILINEQIESDTKLQDVALKTLLENDLSKLDQLKWTVSEENFTLYFNNHELATDADGPLIFTIPMEKLVTHLKGHVVEEEGTDTSPQADQDKQDVDIAEEKPIQNNIQKYVALTFDDGPSPTVTPKILAVLKQYNAKGTFFMIGNEVKSYPEIAKQVVNDGHEVANHTYNHPNLTKMSYAGIDKEFSLTKDTIEQATGVRPTLLRPPSGAYNNQVINYADQHNNSIILWSVDPRDWQSRNASSVYEATMKNVTSGSIILLHDIYPSTAEALPRVLSALSKEGYEFITVSELLALQEQSGSGPYTGIRITK